MFYGEYYVASTSLLLTIWTVGQTGQSRHIQLCHEALNTVI